ncbi:hypothetical protein DIPPA_06252 [Diplonema papillatum]|nr:hypothetical protein DIPPA_06252 [Diplonema papillatum]
MNDGPGKKLWHMTLSRQPRQQQPEAFGFIALDRPHLRLATFNLRSVYIVDLDKKTRQVFKTAQTLLPAARTFTSLAWCKSESAQHQLAAVLGTDVLVIDTITLDVVAHIPTPCGRSSHPAPLIEWGGTPCYLITAGSQGTGKLGQIRLWDVVDSGAVPVRDAITVSDAPQAIAVHPSQPFLAVFYQSVVQVWSVQSFEKELERDFLSQVRCIAWCASRPAHLLVLYHSDGKDRCLNAPVLAEMDVRNDTCVDEVTTLGRHALSGFATVKLHTLPLPFAPKLLLVAFSSNRCEQAFIRTHASDGATQPPEYAPLPPFVPSQGVRAVAVRRLDTEVERALHLLIVYSSGHLVSRQFLVKPMDVLLDRQVKLLQDRKDVELVKLQSADNALHSIKLRVRVPALQVPFLEQTHHSSKNPPVVFFEISVTQGELLPEVVVKNDCIRSENELSLHDRLIDEISVRMKQAMLDAFQNSKPWLPSMLDACSNQLASFGSLQPSQLKKLSSPLRIRGPSRTLPVRSTTPETPVSHNLLLPKSMSNCSGSLDGLRGTPPSTGEHCPYLPVSSPQVCYKKAYDVQPRYSAAVFTSNGSLLCYGFGKDTTPKVHILRSVARDALEAPKAWDLTPTVEACIANSHRESDKKQQTMWRAVAALLSSRPSRSFVLKSAVGAVLQTLLAGQRYYSCGAVASILLLHASSTPQGGLPASAQSSPAFVRPLSSFISLPPRTDGDPPSPWLKKMPSGASEAEAESLDGCMIPPPMRRTVYSCIRALLTAAMVSGCLKLEREAASAMYVLLRICKLQAADGGPEEQIGLEYDVPRPRTLCSVCGCEIRGLLVTCVRCNHASHLDCSRRWFGDAGGMRPCPEGCDCACVFTWT